MGVGGQRHAPDIAKVVSKDCVKVFTILVINQLDAQNLVL